MRFNSIKMMHIYIAILVIIGVPLLSVQADLKDPTLSVYYSFDNDDATVKDGSIQGNNGMVVGNAKYVDGQIGKALEFNGSTYVDMNGPEFKNVPIDGITLAVWVNHTGINGVQQLLDALGTGQASGLFHAEIRTGGFRWFHRDIAGTEVFNINPGPVIDANEWVHFTGTYDSESNEVKTYINGEETSHSKAGSGNPLADNWGVSASIGVHKNDRWLQGLLDEFYIFSRALSANEIKTVMAGEYLSVEPTDKLATTWGDIKAR